MPPSFPYPSTLGAWAPSPLTWAPGTGHLCVSSPGPHNRSGFSTLRASYPLKLLAPSPLPSQPPHLALCYTLAYGGGLVAADAISLSIEVEEDAALILLTQGSTKVFKHRPGLRPASHGQGPGRKQEGEGDGTTRQRMLVRLASRSMLLLLPDSISPFRSSRYAQAQRFILPSDETSSVLILDWVNSGRQADGEVWSMARYSSTNEIFLGSTKTNNSTKSNESLLGEKRLIMRERTLLEQNNRHPKADIAHKLAPYHVYANILIIGPHVFPLLKYLTDLCAMTSQFQAARPQKVIWSFSPVEDGKGGVVRVAADEVEDARAWIREVFDKGGVRDLVGDGLWGRII
ncbi:UreD urease accessory protein-domain-containing protein [Naematelia encephala]|uniref:UreD urease accessory protein-domain-containing protein n=1 Tax=Naematelia encephala TaxID=71784 RepID=A0A1Y2B306_9TREE|nr:UreD urease accessory protein-domain-containing protein [Naematelia encephala]